MRIRPPPALISRLSRPTPTPPSIPTATRTTRTISPITTSTITSPTMTNFNITITSDIVCPWCYIGHARLDAAIANHKKTHPTDTFNLTYRPFYLNPPPHTLTHTTPPPSFPVKSTPRADYYNAKFGAARARQVHAAMDQVTKPLGLNFKYGGMTGPSRNGHRLVHHAQTHGGQSAQNDVMTGLWRRYLEQEVDITRLDVLTEVGVEAGLGTAEEVRRFLESDEGGVEVDRLAEEARMDGVSGVPHYVVQDMWEVGGAQEPRAFEQLFQRYKDMTEKQVKNGDDKKTAEGQYCTKDGCF